MTLLIAALFSCSTSRAPEPTPAPAAAAAPAPAGAPAGTTATAPAGRPFLANVEGVGVEGSDGTWQFAVTLHSDETGCDRYADWWEVLLPDGTLVYRRILVHSHPSEQPFTRAGGPVAIGADQVVFVRAHLHAAGSPGYGGAVFSGTPAGGFTVTRDVPPFPETLEKAAPQPSGCLF